MSTTTTPTPNTPNTAGVPPAPPAPPAPPEAHQRAGRATPNPMRGLDIRIEFAKAQLAQDDEHTRAVLSDALLMGGLDFEAGVSSAPRLFLNVPMLLNAWHKGAEDAWIVAGRAPEHSIPSWFDTSDYQFCEYTVLAWLERISQNNKSDQVCFYTLSNGGFYFAPTHDTSLRRSVGNNYFSGTLSPDAAGVAATLFALGQWLKQEKDDLIDYCYLLEQEKANDPLVECYHLLRDFAVRHPEANLIFDAI